MPTLQTFYNDVIELCKKIPNAQIDDVVNEAGKVINHEWTVGFQDRGMGHGDYAVMTKETNLVIAECATAQIAQHICDIHNKSLEEKK